jgi:hypothetical protein
MKRLILTAAIALQLSASGVLVTPHGKTFHASRKCMSLSRSKAVTEVTVLEAKSRNLKPCGICYRVKPEPPR